MRALAIVLIAAGIVLMIFTGITFITKKKVADLGPVEINKEEKTPVHWSPIIGAVLLVGGIVVLLSNRKTVA